MNLRLFLALIACAGAAPAAFALAPTPSRPAPHVAPLLAPEFRAPQLAPIDVVSLAPPLEAKSASTPQPHGPRRVGSVRALSQSIAVAAWTPIAGGYVAKLRVTSASALGLRVRIDLGTLATPVELRVQGDDGRIETQLLGAANAPEAWGPWTPGESQVLELFTRERPAADAVRIGALVHFDTSIALESAAICTIETMCAADDPLLAPGLASAIEQREKSVIRLNFVDKGQAFLCTGTLIDTEKFPAPYVLTANHCINNQASANSIGARWFYESDAQCPDRGFPAGFATTNGGMQLVFTNYNVDSTLLLMNVAPPDGAVYAGIDPAPLASGDAIVSVSHPEGDTARYAVGNIDQNFRLDDWPQEFYGVRYTRGIIQGGSSGSGLFTTGADGSLQLRGILTGTTVQNSAEGLSCTDLNEDGLYSELPIFAPEIEPYITKAGVAPDDAPNRPQDFAGTPFDASGADILDTRATPFELDNRRIDYAGDLDVFRFRLSKAAYLSAWSDGPGGANLDTVGTLLDSNGVEIAFNDDAQTRNNHFGFTHKLSAGTYFVQVAHWDAGGTGTYNLHARADTLDTNYTDLWWNPNESGWGINLNHQDNILFATLFTYDFDGSPMWLVMPGGARQADGTYSGQLFRTTGPAFDAQPFGAIASTVVGTMKLAFTDANDATLTYSYNGTNVTKSITRQPFAATPPSCQWSAFDRSFSNNFQDLWFNPNESGWGVNVAQHGNTIFATLFTYDNNGKGMWLVLPDGEATTDGKFSGAIYRTTGPAFNASPWHAIASTAVGTMTFDFSNGNAGTLTYSVDGVTVTKAIQRQVFGNVRTDCGS